MGLFDLFNNREENSPAKEHLIAGKEFFDKGEYQECLRNLSWGFKKDVNFRPLYELASQCLEKLGGEDEKALFDAVCRNQKNVTAYLNLGNFYFGIGYYDMAQVFYEKTLELDPNAQDVPHDLALCYARRFQIGKAIEVLTKSGSNDFWNLYFLNKCKILNQDVGGVEESLGMLLSFLSQHHDQQEVALPRMKIMELKEILKRYHSVKKIEIHIRDWHFVQYGGVVLDFFESDDYVAGGRYVASWGSMESLKTLALKFKKFLEALSVSPQSVASLSDRDSEICGRMIANILGLNFGVYHPNGTFENCLIIASDSQLFNEFDEFNEVKSGQLLFAINHNWLANSVVCPDIVGFMTQTYSFPWSGGGFRIGEADGQVERIPEDTRPVAEIVAELSDLQPKEQEAIQFLDFYLEHKDYLKGIGKFSGNSRYNFMMESPVPGSYFG